MSSSTFNHRQQRNCLRARQSGFTLVELLVVIAIIGILVGLLLVAGRGAVLRAQEFSVSAEITQMSQAAEQFQIKYGFYPPSDINGGNGNAQIKRILARIAPNHRHTDAELNAWHTNFGDRIDETNALTFWLGGGLRQNKQQPLGTAGPPETFYDFDSSRIMGGDLLNGYQMEYGASNGDRTYRYFGSDSYAVHTSDSSTDPKPYTLDGDFINPDTFQIVCGGIDADFGVELITSTSVNTEIKNQGVKYRDNLTNLGDGGRLEVFVSNL